MVDESSRDKSSLLSQLKIDRDEKEEGRLSIPIVLALLVLMLVIGVGSGRYFFAPEADQSEKNIQDQSLVSSVRKDSSANDGAAKENNAVISGSNGHTATASTAVEDNGTGGESILDASGYITARRIATVSAELTGRITEVLVEEGMKVEKGQILAHLDDAIAQVNFRLAKARMDAAQSRVESSKASYAEAKRILERVSKLKSNDFSSEANLTNSALNVEVTKADLSRVIADLEVARLEVARQNEIVEDHTVRAPFTGIVTIKNAQPGEIVAPGSAGGGFTRTGICTIVDMDSLEIEADVNEAFIGRIFEGQRVRANLDAYPDWDIPASVIAIIPTANRDKATVRVRIKIEVADNKILPDMGVKISFYGS